MHVDAVVSELERASDYAIVTISTFVLSLFTGSWKRGRWEKKQGEMGENVRRTDLKQEESLSEPSYFCSYIYTM